MFFIQSGKCKVVREITIIRSTSTSGKTKLKLPPIDFTEGDSEGNKTDKVVKKYLTIHVLKEGDFFGVGEDLKKTYIISVGRVRKHGNRALRYNVISLQSRFDTSRFYTTSSTEITSKTLTNTWREYSTFFKASM